MKQIGLGVQMYIQDNDEHIFNRTGWAYSRSGNLPTTNATRWYNQIYPYIKSVHVYTCPDDPNPTPSIDAATGVKDIPRSYVANSTVESLSLAQISDPTEALVITEKWSTDGTCNGVAGCVTDSWLEPFNGDMTPDHYVPTNMYKVATYHQGMTNCAFFDGHAKALHIGAIQGSKDVTGCSLVYANPYPASPVDGSMTGYVPSNGKWAASSDSQQPDICDPAVSPTFTYP
jgi:prepilin-type processing-associated H-X9-DG protein